MFKFIKTIENIVYYISFKIILLISSIPARLGWDGFTRGLMRFNARFILLYRRGQHKSEISAIGNEWKRMFPTESMQEIISVDDHTFYARTHTWCPLRGTGDVHACYRLMEFDRTLLETIGGQLIVLRSQAQPGEKTCTIAIRRLGEPTDDLIPAHKQIS